MTPAGAGPFALVNSHCDGENCEDSELITPSVDMSALSSVQVRFHQDFNGGSPAFGEIADVDVSTDGGVSWTNVFHQTVAVAGPNTQSVDVTALAAGQADVRARFHYHNAFAALWWQVDDVILGQTSCGPCQGGLVVGNVLDANTGSGSTASPWSTTVGRTDGDDIRDSAGSRATRRVLRPVLGERLPDHQASLDLYVPRRGASSSSPTHAAAGLHLRPDGWTPAPGRSARVDPGEIVDRRST